jgi:hypothetical protein
MTLTSKPKHHSLDAVAVAKSKQSTLEQRVEAFRALVREAIRKADERGQQIKPYDGTVSLQWPAMVHASTTRSRRYTLRLSCSVLGGYSSHYSWSGRSWRTVFAHAAEDVAHWTSEMEKSS